MSEGCENCERLEDQVTGLKATAVEAMAALDEAWEFVDKLGDMLDDLGDLAAKHENQAGHARGVLERAAKSIQGVL